MEEDTSDRFDELKNMIMAVSELVKDVPILEIKIEELKETLKDLKNEIEREKPATSGPTEDLRSILDATTQSIKEMLEATVRQVNEDLNRREESFLKHLDDLKRMIKPSIKPTGTSDRMGSVQAVLERIDELKGISEGQYSEMKSLIGDIEITLLAKQHELSQIIKKDG